MQEHPSLVTTNSPLSTDYGTLTEIRSVTEVGWPASPLTTCGDRLGGHPHNPASCPVQDTSLHELRELCGLGTCFIYESSFL